MSEEESPIVPIPGVDGLKSSDKSPPQRQVMRQISDEEKQELIRRATLGITNPEKIFKESYSQINRQRISANLDSAGIPAEFFNYSMSEKSQKKKYSYSDVMGNIDESRKHAYDTIADYISAEKLPGNLHSGRSVFVFGEANSHLGISLLCTFLLRAAIENGYRGKYISFISLCEEITNFNPPEDSEDYFNVPALMIDTITIGNGGGSVGMLHERVRGRLSSLLKYRADKKLPTFFASHTNFLQFWAAIDDSLTYSYNSNCEHIEILKKQGFSGANNLSVNAYIESLKKKFGDHPFATAEKLEAHLREFKKSKR